MQFTRLPLAVLTVSSAFILIATSCKKSSSTPENASLSATMGKTNYNPSLTSGFDQYGYVNVQGLMVSSGDSISLQISVPDTTTRTTLDLDDVASSIDYFDTKVKWDYNTGNYGSHGTLTITSWDKTNSRIAGKFSGVLYDAAGADSVSASGQFNISYKQ